MRAVVTVIGKDRTGIIAKVSGYLAENEINILDISQTIMQDIFTMIMLVDTQKSEIKVSTLSEDLEKIGEDIGVEIKIQHEGLFTSMHRI